MPLTAEDASAMDVFYARMGIVIASARRKAGFTQQALAEKLGHTRSSIANIETGRQKPLPHHLQRIADVLEIKVETLFPPSLKEIKELRATLDALPEEVRLKIERHLPGSPI